MRLFRIFLILITSGLLALGTSACAGEVSDSPDASTTTGVGPQEVEGPGEGNNTPGSPNSPGPAGDEPAGGGQDDPGAGVGGEQSNP